MRLAVLMTSCAMPVMAQDISLSLPIDCTLGDTCYIQNYVDHDPSDAASDFQCGGLTYDTHKGTDFGLISLAAMERGVNVFASAPGTVHGVRDILFTSDLSSEINGHDCGNGVVVAHDNGWETQYCHMREGSVSVIVGDLVEPGDVLGQVGLSGRTQFPHVHISVRQGGQLVDPFAPDGVINCGTLAPYTLWAVPIDTPAGGFSAPDSRTVFQTTQTSKPAPPQPTRSGQTHPSSFGPLPSGRNPVTLSRLRSTDQVARFSKPKTCLIVNGRCSCALAV